MSFRSRQRSSDWRANVFLLECVAVLSVQSVALYRWVQPGPQQVLLGLFVLVYLARLNIMARWILPRELSTEEITFVTLIWVPSILASFTYGASLRPNVSATQLVLAATAYAGGSFLNTFSELQRKWWKVHPWNKGRCYTLGLFSLSRNINYFGDLVLFAGWAAATGWWWNAWVLLVMFLAFYFLHIPEKEKYLAQRYAQDWPSYAFSTKALIPWVL